MGTPQQPHTRKRPVNPGSYPAGRGKKKDSGSGRYTPDSSREPAGGATRSKMETSYAEDYDMPPIRDSGQYDLWQYVRPEYQEGPHAYGKGYYRFENMPAEIAYEIMLKGGKMNFERDERKGASPTQKEILEEAITHGGTVEGFVHTDQDMIIDGMTIPVDETAAKSIKNEYSRKRHVDNWIDERSGEPEKEVWSEKVDEFQEVKVYEENIGYKKAYRYWWD